MIRVKLSEHELDKLIDFRQEAGLTKYRVSVLLDMNNNNYCRYECGANTIPLEHLEKLAELYGKKEITKFGVRVERNESAIDKKMSEEEKPYKGELIAPVLNAINSFRKTRTKQTDELNFYIPEKWMR
jgi:transcriptional regulator with XRE-family HTH domain